MLFLEYLLWTSCFLVFYNYAGYAIIVWILNKIVPEKKQPLDPAFTPSVSFIVAAFNEEDCMEAKIKNSLAQDYPRDKIEFIFITDGSSDGTNDVIAKYPDIKLLFQPERRGKSAALNRAVKEASNDILIFSDANTNLNIGAVRNIARHYFRPETGGVAGEKKVLSEKGAEEVGAGEGLYWKYESALKKLDSDFYSVVGAAGELFSLRRELFEPVAHDVVLDDFVISMKVAAKGFRIVYEPDAYAMELPSFSIGDEKKRKVRIAAGGFQAMRMLPSLLAVWRLPKLSFLYLSHRAFRWTLSPLCMILAFVSNLILALISDSMLYRGLLLVQILFYAAAIIGANTASKKGLAKIFRLAYYFVFMNLSVVLGFFRYLRGNQPAAWEKARRAQAMVTTESV